MYPNRERFLAILENTKSKQTVVSYDGTLSRFFNKYTEITSKTVQDFVVSLRVRSNTREATTVSCYVQALKKYCRIFELPVNFELVELPKRAHREGSYITPGVFNKGINTLCVSGIPEQQLENFVSFFSVLYYTGMRVNELLSLTADNVFIGDRYIRLIGKGNKERKIPLPDCICGMFTDPFFSFLSSVTYIVVYRLIKQIFGPTFSPHSFRHGYTTNLVNGGVEVTTIQKVLGHASVVTTLRYTHNTYEEASRKVLTVLNVR